MKHLFHNSAKVMHRKGLMTQYEQTQEYLAWLKETRADYEMQLARHNAEEAEFDRKIKRVAVIGFAVCAAVAAIMIMYVLGNCETPHAYLV